MAKAHKRSTALQDTVAPVLHSRRATGVAYVEAHGLAMFRCEPFRANLTMRGCGQRWLEAQSATGHAAERYETCRGCPIGAAHAGYDFVRYSPLYGAPICPRCRNEKVDAKKAGGTINRGGLRMIGNRLCVSCYNRSNELRKGRNARGNLPVELMERTPRPIEFRLTVNGVARVARDSGVDTFEPMVQVLRTTKGEISFSFHGPASSLRQGRLF
jgi:hypothetical protein